VLYDVVTFSALEYERSPLKVIAPSRFVVLRHNQFYLGILFLSLRYVFQGRYAYEAAFLRYVGCRLLINCLDDYFAISVACSIVGARSVYIQNGYRDSVIQKLNVKPSISLFFSMSPSYSKWLSAHVDATFINHGSLKNNMRPKLPPDPVVRKVFWISHYSRQGIVPRGRNVSWQHDIYDTNRIALEALLAFCRKNNLEVAVLCRFNNELRHEEERFYEKLGVSLFSPTSTESYDLVSSDSMVVGITSTFAYECFARGLRVAFLCFRGYRVGVSDLMFGWPGEFPDEGDFWTTSDTRRSLDELFCRVFRYSPQEWIKITRRYANVFAYDSNNQALCRTLKHELEALS
jgi:surface carbohydrate biosynthesis protein